MIHPNFIYVGVALQAWGGLSYLIDTLKGKVKPNRVTWFLWTLAPLIAFFAQLQQGVGIESLATFIVGFVPLLVFIASFVNKKSEWKTNALDYWCGGLSLVGLVLWMVTRVGNVAIVFSIIADALACIPTIIKAYHEPETENDLVFIFGFVNALIALLVITTWNFENYGFQLYLLFANALIAALIRFRPRDLFARKK
jgi:hypothetical protein